MNSNIKNFFSFVLRFGLSGALLWWLFRKIDFSQVKDAIAGADAGFLFVAGVFFILANFVILARWIVFIQSINLKLNVFAVTYWFFIGLFSNLFLPTGIGGDVVKIIGLCKKSSDKPKVVASVVLDRLSGFAGIVITAIIAFAFGRNLIQNASVQYSILIMTILSLGIVCVLFNKMIYHWFSHAFAIWPKVQLKIRELQESFLLLKNKPGQGILAIVYSCLAQVLLAISFFYIARAMHQTIPLGYFLVFSPMVCVTSSLPSIGGLGVREAGWAYLFAGVGLSEPLAVSMSLINFTMLVLLGLVGAVLYVASLFNRRIQRS